MKVVCIRIPYTYALTVGKQYDVSYFNFEYYNVISDNGDSVLVPISYFITQEEIRDKKLEELGI